MCNCVLIKSNCQAGCKSFEFECHNGECIEVANICDGNLDCKDGSDESLCGARKYFTLKIILFPQI
jgi:hypothetical protein